ncbi:hypothetical protein BPOR_1282g00020 [Botrytis porri]|uniref:Uncharacterized protein n=1 Tax=Botrytis porri TaxID=87229 RepID=A0A4Z1K6B7_9HELO|nr:hypothetical protein BPOR_1282g00020 [Botrytis porri]
MHFHQDCLQDRPPSRSSNCYLLLVEPDPLSGMAMGIYRPKHPHYHHDIRLHLKYHTINQALRWVILVSKAVILSKAVAML